MLRNPFAELVRVSTHRPRVQRLTEVPRPDTNTGRLLSVLDQRGPQSTVALVKASGLPSRIVWGLLKAPRDRGEVSHAGGLWTVDPDYPGANVVRACELLRAMGWRVAPPEAKNI